MKDNVWKWIAGVAVGLLITVAVLSFSMGRSAVTKADLDALEARVNVKLVAVDENTEAIENLNRTLAKTNLLLDRYDIKFDNLKPRTAEEGP